MFSFPLDRARDRANFGSDVPQRNVSRTEVGTNEMYIGTATGVVRAEAIKRKTEPRAVSLGRVERRRGCTAKTDSRRAACR